MLLPKGDKRDIHRGEISSRPRREAPEGPESMWKIIGFLFKRLPSVRVHRHDTNSPGENTDPREIQMGTRVLLPGDLYVVYGDVNGF